MIELGRTVAVPRTVQTIWYMDGEPTWLGIVFPDGGNRIVPVGDVNAAI